MATATNVVETVAIWKDMMTGGIKKTLHSVESWKNGIQRTEQTIAKLGKKTEELTKVVKKVHGKTKPFRMELLSVMFGAKMVASAFGSLLRPAFEAVGIFDIFGTMLQVLFLPTAIQLLKWVIDFAKFFMELPQPVKETLGALLAVLTAFFTFVATKAALRLFFAGWLADIKTIKGTLVEVQKFAKITISFLIIEEGLKDLKEGKILDAAIDTALLVSIFKWSKLPFAGKFIVALLITWEFLLSQSLKDKIKNQLEEIGTIAMEKFEKFKNFLDPFGLRTMLKKPLPSGYATYKAPNPFGTGQTGIPFVPYTGLYRLHRGETVTPSEQNLTFSPTINIIGGSGMDTRTMANMIKSELNQQWASELSRLARR